MVGRGRGRDRWRDKKREEERMGMMGIDYSKKRHNETKRGRKKDK